MFRSHFSYGNNLLPVPVSKKRKHFPFLCVINCTFKVCFFFFKLPLSDSTGYFSGTGTAGCTIDEIVTIGILSIWSIYGVFTGTGDQTCVLIFTSVPASTRAGSGFSLGELCDNISLKCCECTDCVLLFSRYSPLNQRTRIRTIYIG
jgi:hypothetical protein